jgi:hypothetical protein
VKPRFRTAEGRAATGAAVIQGRSGELRVYGSYRGEPLIDLRPSEDVVVVVVGGAFELTASGRSNLDFGRLRHASARRAGSCCANGQDSG